MDGRVAIVIPARLESSRLPRKVLADIDGHPMLWHVYQRALRARRADEVWIATPDDEVRAAAESWGARVLMTSPDCTCGTERIASMVDKLDAGLIVNVQGDEPLIEPSLIDDLVLAARRSGADVTTPVVQIRDEPTLYSATTVKVVRAGDGRALYFSRRPVPFLRDVPLGQQAAAGKHWLQVGMYAFTKDVLQEYRWWPETDIERQERIEQLRFLVYGKRIATFGTHHRSVAVDVPADLERVRAIIRQRGVLAR